MFGPEVNGPKIRVTPGETNIKNAAKNDLSLKIDQMSSKFEDNFGELKESIDHIKDHVIQQLLDKYKKLTTKVK